MNRELRTTIQVECQQLLNRAAMLLDQCRWEELANCYTEDGLLYRPSDAENPIIGREAILDSFKARPPSTTCHMMSNIVCDVVSSEKVTAVSRVWLIKGEAADTRPVTAGSSIMVGSFEDTLIFVDDQWRIKCRRGGIELKYTYA